MNVSAAAGIGGSVRWGREWKALLLILLAFLALFYLPLDLLRESQRVQSAVWEALYLARWYAREHVVLCLIPAFFIAGAIAVFVSGGSVLKYLGARANKLVAYSVASVSGTMLAVCSCTVLPLFAGIYTRGAGLGPASAFLYAGPAINVLAIIFTARVLGLQLGVARAVGAVLFSVVIGLAMHLVFRREELEKASAQMASADEAASRPLWQSVLFFGALVAILVFANWGQPAQASGLWHLVHSARWALTGVAGLGLAWMLAAWFGVAWWAVVLAVGVTAGLAALFPDQPMVPFAGAVVGVSVLISTGGAEAREWFGSSWGFAKTILPLLLLGVLIAGALLGRPGHEGLIPSAWVSGAVGGNSLGANLFASVAGAFMYFATLTEVPILQGLIGNGMGQGPALALLLAGPAVSLPNMLVIRSVIGTKKTLVYMALVVIMSSLAGLLYGVLVG